MNEEKMIIIGSFLLFALVIVSITIVYVTDNYSLDTEVSLSMDNNTLEAFTIMERIIERQENNKETCLLTCYEITAYTEQDLNCRTYCEGEVQ